MLVVAACSSAGVDTVATERTPGTVAPTTDRSTVADPPATTSAPESSLPSTVPGSVGSAIDATPGAVSLDDPYVGDFGNGGYDVQQYDVAFTWDADRGRIDGTTTIDAVATQDLAAFNLELVDLTIDGVTIDGLAVGFDRAEAEITVVPSEPIVDGSTFEVAVTYEGTPRASSPLGFVSEPSGWHTRDGFAYVAGEPIAAATFHPVNDHPSDKAAFTYRITADSDLDVAAVGTLASTTESAGQTTWVYEQPFPQAPYLTTILIGDFVTRDGGASSSGVPIRNVFAADIADDVEFVFDDQAAMLDVFERLFGAYPFDVYGAAVVPEPLGGALETQTLSIFGSDIVGFGGFAESVVAHELAHQWFGNAVALERWEDIWLNEGFATYAEALWADASDPSFTFDRWVDRVLTLGPTLEAHVHAPETDDLFAPHVYQRGALTLHSLRGQIGDADFFTVLRTWVERFGGDGATTDDFEALVTEISGRDLGEFFDRWLREDELPLDLLVGARA